jgi:phytoene synthase
MGSTTLTSSPVGPEIWASIDRRLRTGDEDRWLSSRYAPPDGRFALIALYGFAWELARVRLIVSEPTMGAIRYQWWRDAIEEIGSGRPGRAHDVVLVSEQLITEGRLSADSLLAMVDAYEDAYEASDPAKMPETRLATLAASLLQPDHNWQAEIEATAPVFARLRRGEDAQFPGKIAKAPPSIRPAIAHFRLRRLYARSRQAGPVERRLCVLKAVMTGRV